MPDRYVFEITRDLTITNDQRPRVIGGPCVVVDEYVRLLLIFGGQISNNNSFFVIFVVFLNYIERKRWKEKGNIYTFSQFKNWLKKFVIIGPVWRKECGIKKRKMKEENNRIHPSIKFDHFYDLRFYVYLMSNVMK